MRLAAAALCALLSPAWAASGPEQSVQDSISRLKAETAARGQRPAAAIPDCAASGGIPSSGCFADSDIENVPGRVYRHPAGWTVEESCFAGTFAGESIPAVLDAAWRKLDPGTPPSSGGCFSRYNPSWGASVAQLLGKRRVLLSCMPGRGCAHTSLSHRFRGTHGPGGFKRTSERGEKWATIGLQDVQNCKDVLQITSPAIVFHETLHANEEPVVNPLAHDASWRAHDPADRIYSAQAVCFEGPRGRYGTTRAQCESVVKRGNPNGNAAALCRDF